MLTAVFAFFRSNNLAAIILAAGLLYTYHTIVVSYQSSQIEKLEKDNSTLKKNQETLELANKSVSANLDKILSQQNNINSLLKSQEQKDREIITGYLQTRESIENSKFSLDSANREIFCLSVSFNKSCFQGNKK